MRHFAAEKRQITELNNLICPASKNGMKHSCKRFRKQFKEFELLGTNKSFRKLMTLFAAEKSQITELENLLCSASKKGQVCFDDACIETS